MARKERAVGSSSAQGRRSRRRQRNVDPTVQTVLTPDGYRLIEERIADIRTRRLAELRPLLVDAAFEALLAEVAAFEALLAEAVVVEPETDGSSVSLGSWVLVRLLDGSSEWVRPVHPSEAFLDDERISIASPLGAALLGATVGSSVTVQAPAGTWSAEVLQVRSEPIPQVLQAS